MLATADGTATLPAWRGDQEPARLWAMAAPLKGLVQGKTVVLDESVPPLEGRRVLVVLEPVDEEEPAELGRRENLEAWSAWVASGPQGPIEDDDEPTFP